MTVNGYYIYFQKYKIFVDPPTGELMKSVYNSEMLAAFRAKLAEGHLDFNQLGINLPVTRIHPEYAEELNKLLPPA